MKQAGVRPGSLTVIGTGMSGAGQVTAEAHSALRDAERIFYLVQDAVTRAWLQQFEAPMESLFEHYQPGRDRSETYERIVTTLVEAVLRGQRVCAAFYGHPGVFVSPGHEAVRRVRAAGFQAEMLPGVSAVDCLVADLGFDPGSRGTQSFEATDFLLRHRVFDPTSHLILWQIGGIGVRDYRSEALWSRRGLEHLVDVLTVSYPDDHQVVVYEAAPFPPLTPQVERCRLVDLVHGAVTVRSTLWVPPLEDRATDRALLERLTGE